MLKSKKYIGIKTVIELQLNPESDQSYISENGIISHNCEWCHHFYLNNDGTPKVYKLAELQNNGTNIGKPKQAWKPVLGPTHIRCRCQLEKYEKKE